MILDKLASDLGYARSSHCQRLQNRSWIMAGINYQKVSFRSLLISNYFVVSCKLLVGSVMVAETQSNPSLR